MGTMQQVVENERTLVVGIGDLHDDLGPRGARNECSACGLSTESDEQYEAAVRARVRKIC